MSYKIKMLLAVPFIAVLLAGLVNTIYQVSVGSDSTMFALFTWTILIPTVVFIFTAKLIYKNLIKKQEIGLQREE